MKSYMATGSDPSKPEKFLAYMVPSPDEVSQCIIHFNIVICNWNYSFLFL